MNPVAIPIPLDELPAHMRALAEDMRRVGAAIRYYGGFGPFAEYGDMLETQSAPICHSISTAWSTRSTGSTGRRG